MLVDVPRLLAILCASVTGFFRVPKIMFLDETVPCEDSKRRHGARDGKTVPVFRKFFSAWEACRILSFSF